MNPLEQIQQIREAINAVVTMLSQRTDPLPEELKIGLAEVLTQATQRIQQLQGEQGGAPPQEPPPTAPPPQQPIPESAQLLWILSGGNRNVFFDYLQTFPSQETNRLLQDLPRLNTILGWLETNMPQGERNAQADGVDQSPIPSSNVWGFNYNPKTGGLRVRFNEGAVYEYSGVPKRIFDLFAQGAIPAKTSGRNRFGQWWQGKKPSVGASLHQLIKLGGFPYQRVS